MYKIITVILFMMIAGFAPASAQIKNISPVFAEQSLMRKKVIVLDVRTKQEYKEGHLPNAVHIDVTDSAAFVQKIQALKKRKTYIVYCKSGKRSAKASEILLQQGFKHIWNIEGGITAWQGKKVVSNN
jgi:rhodanese-related sulfurtransferase